MDFKKQTVLIFPRYLDSINFPVGRALGSVYKELGYNVILLDHFELTTEHFPIAARVIRPVAPHTTEMLAYLTARGLDPKRLDLVRISLGAQAIGLIGKHYQHLTGQNISSLAAINPSGPCFRHLGPEHRIDPSDVDFVLQITTSMDGFGLSTQMWQVAMLVNGGEYQLSDIWPLPCLTVCSHIKSIFFWISALMNPGIFIALQCHSMQQAIDGDCYERGPRVKNTMDLFTDRSKAGVYYLPTFNRYPYGLGKRELKGKYTEVSKRLNWQNKDDVLTVK